jgi:hypothetical protein
MFSAPDAVRTAQRIAVLGVALAGAALALPAVLGISLVQDMGLSDVQALTIVLATCFSSGCFAAVAVRTSNLKSALRRCALAPLFGVANAGIALTGVSVAESYGFSIVGVLFGSLFASVYAVPLGVLFGAAFTIPILATVRAKAAPSYDLVDRVCVVVGVFTACAGVLGIAVDRAMAYSPHAGAVRLAAPLAACALGAALALAAFVRRAARARWLRAVATGAVRDWRILDRTEEHDDAELVPFDGPAYLCDAVLVRAAPPQASPYRSRAMWNAYALVRRR